MKLGVHIGYWGLGLTARGPAARSSRRPSGSATTRVWAAEAYGSDAATVLGWLAGQTTRIKLGSAIFQMPARSPAMTAMTAATLDQLSGRAHAARASARRARRWPRAGTGSASAGSCSARASTSRSCARRSRASALEFHGETLELPLPDGPGKALKLTIAPVQERIPIYLAAIGPKNTRARRRDRRRLDPDALLPRARGRARARCSRRAPRAPGARSTGFDIAPTVNVYVTDDVDAARDVDAAVHRALRRRDGLARAELLQPARRSATGSRTRRARSRTSTSTGKQGGGGGGAPGRADRHGLALRAARRGARAAARLPRRRRRHARGHADGVDREERLEQLRLVAELRGVTGRCGSCSARSAIPGTRSR